MCKSAGPKKNDQKPGRLKIARPTERSAPVIHWGLGTANTHDAVAGVLVPADVRHLDDKRALRLRALLELLGDGLCTLFRGHVEVL